MKIQKQAETFAYRLGGMQWAEHKVTPTIGDGLLHATGRNNSYLIDAHPEPGAPAGGVLLHYKTNAAMSGNTVWKFHSAHPDVEHAQAAAERHDMGG